ncbi:MAG: class I SAM-dependent methyltransferase [Anaerolineae bacterium]
MQGPDARRYYVCDTCALIFVDPAQHLSPDEERARYLLHQNSRQDHDYVAFLNRLLRPLLPYLDAGARGLDYGCGPVPVLSHLAREQGIVCDDYDPFFADGALNPPYGVVFASECFEHFHRPAAEMARILALLQPGGLLGIMTERWTTPAAFAGWYYAQAPTHVCFYHADTFDFLCDRFGLTPMWRDEKRVIILRRNVAGVREQ